MPDVPASSLLGYIGVVFILLGLFLLISGVGIIRVDQITVSSGTRTFVIGLVLFLLGIIMISLETVGFFNEDVTPSPTTTIEPTFTPTLIHTPPATSIPNTPTPEISTPTPESPEATNTPTPIDEPSSAIDGRPLSEAQLGESWMRSVDNTTMFFVPSGSFMMGALDNDPDAIGHEKPSREVIMTAYWIDATEVTNAQFAAFLNSNGNLVDEGTTWYEPFEENAEIEFVDDSYRSKFGVERRPVVFVSWFGADAYCNWIGGSLPTEAQWEYAARGTSNPRFPWGNALPTSSRLNFNKNIGQTVDVASYPNGVSWVGAFDMAGNVLEWVNDWYDVDYYENAPSIDPTGPSGGLHKIVRGGGWQDPADIQRTTWRNYIDQPRFRVEDVGFRCVISMAE